MGVPWLAQVRLMHLAFLGMATVTCLLYISYVTSPMLTPTASPIRLLAEVRSYTAAHHNNSNNNTNFNNNNISSSSNRNNNNNSSQIDVNKNETLLLNNVNSDAPPPLPVHDSNIQQIPKQKKRQQPPPPPPQQQHNKTDVIHGVPAEYIYEAGHSDVNDQVCPDLGKNIKVLIAITSAPSHENARMAIRETWGHFASRRDVAIAFILGSTNNATLNKNIEKEQYLYGDIIKGKFQDTYDNLTLKTISMLEWVDHYCPNAAFVLKTDDDMFINVAKLLLFISKHNPEQRAIYGRLAKKWKPIRNKRSKYYISPQQYKPSIFPDFTTGPAYLLPAKLSKELYLGALNHTYFKLEDVFVTGIVANSLKIKRIHAPEFINKRVSLTTCTLQKGISIHMIKGIEQYDLWKKLHDVATKCKKK